MNKRIAVPNRPNAIPAELRQRKQWLAWRYENRDGKPTKVPVNGGSSTNPDTWMAFDEAVYVAQFLIKTGKGGVGFVPTADDPFTFIDLDGCVVDGELVASAQEIVDDFDTYWEISPSGTGVRAIVCGSLPVDAGHVNRHAPWAGQVPHTKAQIEAYDQGHYFTLTGNGRGEIADRQAELDAFAAQYLGRREVTGEDAAWDCAAPPPADDAVVLEQAREDARFAAVFDGATVPAGKDGDSDADYELCCRLAEIVGNAPQWIERLWGSSPLSQRDKFDRDDYRTKTIERAIAATGGERNGETASMGFATPPFRSTPTETSGGQGSIDPHAASQSTPVESDSLISDAVSLATYGGLAPGSVGRTASALRSSPRGQTDWLIPGFAARGWTVLVAGREKLAGKGTHNTYLIGCLERAEPTVYGPAADAPVTTLVYTEEPWDSLAEKHESFNVEQATIVFGWELAKLSWEQKVRWLVDTAVEQGHDIIYIDNISRAAGVNSDDESGTGLARKIEPLSDAAKEHGKTVFLDHHTRKSGGRTEDLVRGGTALPGAVENIIVIEKEGDWTSRRRKLSSRGRVKATVWEKTIELDEDGRDYTAAHADFRLQVLAGKPEWTADSYAEAIGRSLDVARRYLNESTHVERVDPSAHGGSGGGSRAIVYRVKDRDSLLAFVDGETHDPQI